MEKKIIYDNVTGEERNIEIEKAIEVPISLQIQDLKKCLQETDYQAIKYAEGQISEEEYAPIKVQRQEWRDEINRLESEVE